jgi:hypothetical protein
MFQYLKEEMDKVVENTISHPQLSELLQQAYMSGEYHCFARETIVEIAIIDVLRK